MGTRTGNPPWEDYPSTDTPVTAAALEAIERELDESATTSHSHVSADVVDAESVPTPSTLVIRDSNGRAQFAAPAAPDDAASKAYVDSEVADVVAGSVASFAPVRAGVVSSSTPAYAPAVTDENKLVMLTAATPVTVTLPADAVAFPVGAVVHFARMGAGTVTFAAGAGATVNGTPSLALRAQYSGASAWKTAANAWWIVGDLA